MTQLKYRYFISDFDGTLLRSDNTISDRTIRAIGNYRAAGGTFLIATGRIYGGIADRLPDIGLSGDLPVIAFHGALVKTSQTKRVLYERYLDSETAAQITREMEGRGIYSQTYIGDDICVAQATDFSRGYSKYFGTGLREVGKLSDFISTNKLDVPKVLFTVDYSLMRDLTEEFNAKYSGRAVFTASNKLMFECMNPNVGKDIAAEFVVGQAGCTLQDVAAAGDSFNDLTMVARAGLGIAVANAEAEVRNVAKIIAKSNDEDGVAEILERITAGTI